MTNDELPDAIFIKSCISLLLLLIMTFSFPEYAKGGMSAWRFDSEEGYCFISTSVQSDESLVYVLASVNLSLYYSNKPVVTDHCEETLDQNVISAIIYSNAPNKIQAGTHALLQSKNLFNEQAPAFQFNPGCSDRGAYSLDYRVTDILLTDLLAEENIRLTAYLEKYGAIAGPVRTNGFEAAYESLANCIDRLNQNR